MTLEFIYVRSETYHHTLVLLMSRYTLVRPTRIMDKTLKILKNNFVIFKRTTVNKNILYFFILIINELRDIKFRNLCNS